MLKHVVQVHLARQTRQVGSHVLLLDLSDSTCSLPLSSCSSKDAICVFIALDEEGIAVTVASLCCRGSHVDVKLLVEDGQFTRIDG